MIRQHKYKHVEICIHLRLERALEPYRLMHPEELRALAVQLACTSLALSQQQVTQVETLAYSIPLFCEQKWDVLVQFAVDGSLPLLYCHGSDGWSRIISETVQVKLDQHLIKRHGNGGPNLIVSATI